MRGIIQIIMQKIRSFLIVIAGIFLVLCGGGDLFAESVCRADVSYSWVKTAPTDSEIDGKTESVNPAKASVTPNSPEESHPTVYTVHFTSIERTAGVEEVARTLIEGDVQRQRARAFERCRRAHESFGDCVSTKLSTKGMVLNSLSFSARSQVEKALLDECRSSQGECKAVTASEPVCVTIRNEKAKKSNEQDGSEKLAESQSDTAAKTDKTTAKNKSNQKKK